MDRGASRSTSTADPRACKGTGTCLSANYAGTDIPDSITPFIGVRAWMVNKTLRNEERLFSVYKTETNWPTRRRLEAHCIQPASVWAGMAIGNSMFVPAMRGANDPVKRLPPHAAPYNDCSCGIYALNSTLHEAETQPWQSSAIKGIVLLWGHVVEGERGWRAQYGRIAALLQDSEDPERIAQVERMAQLYRSSVISNLHEELERQRQLQGKVLL